MAFDWGEIGNTVIGMFGDGEKSNSVSDGGNSAGGGDSGGGGGMYSVAVNPHSSTDAASGAGGGVGSQTFNIGGNPNVQSFAQSKTWPWAVAAVALVGVYWLIKRK